MADVSFVSCDASGRLWVLPLQVLVFKMYSFFVSFVSFDFYCFKFPRFSLFSFRFSLSDKLRLEAGGPTS